MQYGDVTMYTGAVTLEFRLRSVTSEAWLENLQYHYYVLRGTIINRTYGIHKNLYT